MTNNSKKSVSVPLLIGVGVIVGLMLGGLSSVWRNAGAGGRGGGVGSFGLGGGDDKISYTMALIEKLYVDPVNPDSLADVAIPVILSELDPHSVYIPARDMSAVSEPLEGEFDGIGVKFNMMTDTVVVLNVIPLGPSDKAGVQNGDRIIRIDDSLVAGRKVPQEAIMKRLRGPRGTVVSLGIERRGARGLVPITVTRGVIPIKALDAAFMIAPEVAFVKLSAFSRVSFVELQKALVELDRQGMKRLVLDLRDNGGGYLDQAIAIANMFLSKGEVIVYTRDRNNKQERMLSDGSGSFQNLPLVMLIDEQSASSSEILAGAVQDNDRGYIVGRRSFGKGLVQREIPYRDGSALRLTIARYYTPAGRSIQKPYDHGTAEYVMDVYNRYSNGEMFSADSIKMSDTVRYFTRGGRVVYGGGGIMPDYFVGIDTVAYTSYFNRVNGANLIYRFILEWGDRHRTQMNAVHSTESLGNLLDSYPGLVDEFVAYAARNGVRADYKQIAVSRPLIAARLRAMIGLNTVLEYSGFYSEIYPVDPALRKAIEVVIGAGASVASVDSGVSGPAATPEGAALGSAAASDPAPTSVSGKGRKKELKQKVK